MHRCGIGLIAAMLALTGCKSADSKSGEQKNPPRKNALQTGGKGPAWLEGSLAKIPGAGTRVPNADSWTKPSDPNFNVANEVKGVLAGRVLDPLGHGAKSVYIRIEQVDPAPGGGKDGAAIGIMTDNAGFFMAKGLRPGQTFVLTVEASMEGKTLYGVVQARTPQSNITIALRDDLPPPPAPELPSSVAGPSTVLPPPAPTSSQPTGNLPLPETDRIPAPSAPMRTRPTDGAWGPDAGTRMQPIPATLDPLPGAAPPPASPLPPPAESPQPTPVRPENRAEGPAPVRPPILNVPGPTGPPVPPLPSTAPPLPRLPAPGSTPGQPSSRSPRPLINFALVDGLERPWDFASQRQGSLVLLDFMTTNCVPCKRAVPILVDLQSRYAANGLQLVGVVCDDAPQRERAAMAIKYQRDHNLNYALYVEPGPEPGAVRDRFEVESYPTLILLNGEGRVVWKGHPAEKGALESAIRRELGR
jgi:thiol-disulfide isomerase/thioredoxin